ncbi:MAG: DUF2149 domain-containing protein [Actinobacteria bacterium]|nr:DUF2149 domain-containing protein [Actinomycetota bacterium]
MNRFAQRSRTGIRSVGSPAGDGRAGPRFMGRRRLDRTDRNGDPLDGVVNLFDVAIVLAVAFLLAALSGIGLSDLLAGEDMTLVKNPGQADMELIIREGDTLQRLQLQPGEQTSGVGELIGQFYRLDDGSTVYVPVGTETRENGRSRTTEP